MKHCIWLTLLQEKPSQMSIIFLKTPNLMEKVINMDKSVNKMYEKTLHVLQDQKEYLAYIRVEQAELDYKAR